MKRAKLSPIFSVVVCLIFFSQTIFLNADVATSPSLADLSVPQTLGKIEDRFHGSSERWVIQIQDVHAHALAQENIAAIIDHLNQVYGVSTIALEGGWSETSLPKSQAVPFSREKQLLAQSLLEEGHIGGPVFASIMAQTPLNIVGIENESMYSENLSVYLEHLKKKESITASLTERRKKIEAQKSAVFNPDLLHFDHELTRFRDGHKAEQFLPALVQMARTQEIDLTAFPQVQLFEKIIITERRINKPKLEEEAKRLMQIYKKTRLTFEELLRGGQINSEKIEFYPQSKKYLALIRLQDEIDHHVFFGQIDALVEKVKEMLITSEEERALDADNKTFHLLNSIILFQATPSDIMTFNERRETIRASAAQWDLVSALDLALSFYELAIARDRVFFEKITSDARLQGNVILVTGGFHTSGLSEHFRKAGISYITVTPDIGVDGMDEEIYYSRLKDNVPAIQTLSHEKNRYAFLDDDFPEAVEELRVSNNIYKGVERAVQFSGASASSVSSNEVFDLETLNAMSTEEKQQQIEEIFALIKDGSLPIAIVIRASTLAELLKDPVGLTLWEEVIAGERTNQVVIIRDTDDILDATIGISAQILRVQDDTLAIDEIIRTRLRNKKDIAVIDAEYLKEHPDKRILALPAHPVSFLLARVMLESQMNLSLDTEFLSAFSDELAAMFRSQDRLRQAA